MLSTPEPGLALIGAGKRDVPHDLGLPVASAVRGQAARSGRSGVRVALTALNDQHGYLRGLSVEPG